MRTDQSVTLTELSTDRLLGPRFLKPRMQLRRLRPVRLGVVAGALRGTLRQARGMQLIGRYFPGEWSGLSLADDWEDTMREFLRYVGAAGWFGIYWDGLDHLWEAWMNDGNESDNPDQESDVLTMLADFLEYIPVNYFNFGEEDWLNSVAEELPILCLIRGLVDPTWEANISELRVEYEVWDNDLPADFDPRFFSVPPDTYAPLCWLPDVVRYCARETGNELLDTGVDAIWEQDWSTYRWDRPEDIELLKLLYPPALQGWERVQAFLKWCDGPEEVGEMMGLLFAETATHGTQAGEGVSGG